MEKTYVIAWKSKHGDGAGLGKKLFSREEAETLAAELNRDYPEFEHTVAESGSPEADSVIELPTEAPSQGESEAEGSAIQLAEAAKA